jgi:general secretion pathway protein A
MLQNPNVKTNEHYEPYYGFRQTPFGLTPNPRFVFPSKSHERTLQTILHGLARREGLMLITGDIGCGKTTLCRRLLSQLPPRTFISVILNPFLTAEDLLKQVLVDFGLVSNADIRGGALTNASCHDLVRTLHDFLGSLARLDASAVIILDEAQDLTLRTIEQIRLLSNYETDSTKLLQIILAGQLNLEAILELESLRQFGQRISRRCRLEPLEPDEVKPYIAWRITAALADPDRPVISRAAGRARDAVNAFPFSRPAIEAISRISGRVPRIINLLCDRALERGRANGRVGIDIRLVSEAARDLKLDVPLSIRIVEQRAAAAILATSALCAAAIVLVRQLPAEVPPSPVVQESVTAAPSAPVSASAAAPAPEPPPIPEVPSLAAVGAPGRSFELAVASFRTATRARDVAGTLQQNGYPASVVASAQWQRVIVGPFATLDAAEAARTALAALNFTDVGIRETR